MQASAGLPLHSRCTVVYQNLLKDQQKLAQYNACCHTEQNAQWSLCKLEATLATGVHTGACLQVIGSAHACMPKVIQSNAHVCTEETTDNSGSATDS